MLLLAVAMLLRGSQNMAQTTFPLLAGVVLHLPAATVGILAAAGSLVAIAAMTLGAARVTPRRAPLVLAGSLLLLAAAFPLIAAAGGVPLLAAGVLVLGAAGGIGFPTLISAVGAGAASGAGPGARDRPIALLSVALSASLVIGPFAEGLVLDAGHGDLRTAFLWFGLAPVLAAGLLALRPWARGRRAGPVASPGETGGGERLGLRRALGEPDFTVALLGQLLYSAPFAALIVFGALFARHVYGLSPSAIQLVFGTFFGVSLVVRLVVAWRSPVRHKLRWFRVSALLTGLGLLVLAGGRGEAELLIAMALLGAPHGLTFPLAMAMVAERRRRRELISLNAHLTASVQAVNLILPPVIGLGIDQLGYRVMFLALLLPVAAATLAQHRVGRRRAARASAGG